MRYSKKLKILQLLVLWLLLLTLMPLSALASPDGAVLDPSEGQGPVAGGEEMVAKGKILEVLETTTEEVTNYVLVRERMLVEVVSGPLKGQKIETYNVNDSNMPYQIRVEKGDSVVLYLIVDAQGQVQEAYITERARDGLLLLMLLFFGGLMLLVGGLRGLRAMVALGITMYAILGILLPGILKGWSPMGLSILISLGIIVVSIPLISGLNRKALVAMAGTFSGVLAAGLLAWIAARLAGLTGLSMEEATMLSYIPQAVELDFRGLLFATNILGALGAVMDVAVSVSASLWELKHLNPSISGARLWRSGMNIGKDIIGTMANTLILAYTGGGLYLLLLLYAYEMPLFEIVNLDSMATEIVRALAGSMGLILTIPLTALLGAVFFSRGPGGAGDAEPDRQEPDTQEYAYEDEYEEGEGIF